MRQLFLWCCIALPLLAMRMPEPPVQPPPVDTVCLPRPEGRSKGSQAEAAQAQSGSVQQLDKDKNPSPARHFWRTVGKLALFFAGVQLVSGLLYALATWIGQGALSWSAFLTVGAVANAVIGGALLIFLTVMGLLWEIKRRRHLNEFRAVPTPTKLLGGRRRTAAPWVVLSVVLLLFLTVAFLIVGGFYALIAWIAGWAITWATFSLVGGIGAAILLLLLLVLLILVAVQMERRVRRFGRRGVS